ARDGQAPPHARALGSRPLLPRRRRPARGHDHRMSHVDPVSRSRAPELASDPEPSLEPERAAAAALSRAVAPHLRRLATPALVIDLDAVEHNVAAVVRRVGDASRWRPHVKTIKQPTLVGLLLDAGVHRFKAATPAEVALVLEAAAARALPRPVDVLLAYPAAPPQLLAMLALRRAHPLAR